MIYKIILSFALLTTLFLGSCKEPIGVDENAKITQETYFETIYKGNFAFPMSEPIQVVIRSKNEEEAFLNQIQSRLFEKNGKMLNLDFGDMDYTRDMLICIALGPRSSGSITFEITSVQSTNDNLIVKSVEYHPEMGTTDIGYPMHIIKMKRSDKQVLFAPIAVVKTTGNDSRKSLEFTTIFKESHGIETENKIFAVLKSKADEAEFLSKVKSNNYIDGNEQAVTIGDIDYSKDIVIVAHYGMSSSGSNFIEISSIILENSKIIVNTNYYIPEAGTDDIGHPVHIVKLAKRAEPVKFAETQEIKLSESNENRLLNSSWQWVAYQDGSGNTITPVIEQYSWIYDINFDKTETGFGNSGCNNYGFSYKADNWSLTIDMLFTTKANCAYTSEFMMSLESAESFTMSDDLLYINTKDPNFAVMIFKKK